jgi:hypothetical protein
MYRDNPASLGVISCRIYVKENACWSELLRLVRSSTIILGIHGYLLIVSLVGRLRSVANDVVGRSTCA